MVDTGWVTVGTGANNADAGTTAWTNPSNITTASDSAYAVASSVAKSSGTTQYLHGTNCGFAIPAGSTIDGIEARIRRAKNANDSNSNYEHTIQLILGGTRSGDNKATGASWNTTPTFTTVGGASDLWSLTPTPSDINASSFGLAFRGVNNVAIARDIRIYYMDIKVYYTEPAGNPGAFFTMFNVKDRIREILKPKKKFWLPEPAFARAA